MRLALAVLTLAMTLAAQSGKPNFTGKYQFDAQESKGAGPHQSNMALTVEHNDPKLRYIYESRERQTEYLLTTDGVEQVRDEPKGEVRMSAKWVGEALEIRTFRKLPDREINIVERWSLGEGGVLTMNMEAATKSASGEPGTQQYTIVYRKK